MQSYGVIIAYQNIAMRSIVYTILALMVATPCFGQQPEGIILGERDSSALAILARYDERYDSDRMRIEHWMPMSKIELLYPNGIDIDVPNLLMSSPTIKVTTPTFKDRNSVTLRIGTHGSLRVVISNGSAYNYMPWPNSPAGYRDARTLSFPLPR